MSPVDSQLIPSHDELLGNRAGSVSPGLPEIPSPDLEFDLASSLNSFIGPSDPEVVKVKKRHSHVMKLTQENEKLKAELQAMTDRLEAAERKREVLQRGQQQGESETAHAYTAL